LNLRKRTNWEMDRRNFVGWLCAFLLGFLLLSGEIRGVGGQDEEFEVTDEPETQQESQQESQQDPQAQSPPATASEDEDDVFLEESSLVQSSEDIVTTVFFPHVPIKHIPVASEVTMLVGITNKGDKVFNITEIGGNVHSPYEYSYYLQNFTVRPVGVLLEPTHQLSIEYTFKPDKFWEPIELWFSAHIDYNSTVDNVAYRTVFTNGTMEIVERQSDVNIRRVFTYFFVSALLALLGYVGYHSNFAQSKRKRVDSRPTRSHLEDYLHKPKRRS